jgi:hypothetical protein
MKFRTSYHEGTGEVDHELGEQVYYQEAGLAGYQQVEGQGYQMEYYTGYGDVQETDESGAGAQGASYYAGEDSSGYAYEYQQVVADSAYPEQTEYQGLNPEENNQDAFSQQQPASSGSQAAVENENDGIGKPMGGKNNLNNTRNKVAKSQSQSNENETPEKKLERFMQKTLSPASKPKQSLPMPSEVPVQAQNPQVLSSLVTTSSMALNEESERICTVDEIWKCGSHWPCDKENVFKAIERKLFDVNSFGPDGLTALMKACIIGNESVVWYLLSHGAKVDIQNECGYTALMWCCIYGRKIITQLLVEAGANIDLKRQDGKTARELASHWLCGYPVIVKILDEYRSGKK